MQLMHNHPSLPSIDECTCGASPIAKYSHNIHYGESGWVVTCPDCLTDLARPCATENRAIHRWNQRIHDFK